VPVDDDGNVIGVYESQADIMSISQDGMPLLSLAELQELVGPVALYPDDLLAIVLPASAYPLQIVEAARFLDALESDPSLTPDEDWDDSVVALVNYPEIVALLNEDLDWTLRLGEAVVAQQADVVAAVEAFRDRAYAAGNLKSDQYQTVSDDDGVITIAPVAEDVIYVPYYEPTKVVYYQPEPAYYYYPRPYPVYYYPYAANYSFNYGYFWGVSTAFAMGWYTDSLNVYHHSYYGHPYYGRSYWNHWYYRNPSISVYNTHYVNHGHGYGHGNPYGDHWQARESRREYVRREGYSRNEYHGGERAQTYANERGPKVPVSFRDRGTQQGNPGSRVARNNTNGTANVARQTRDTSRQNVASQTRDTSRQNVAGQSRDARRQDAPQQTRSTRARGAQPTNTQARSTQLSEQLARSGEDKRQQNVATSRDTRRNTNEAQVRNTQQRNTYVAPTREPQARNSTRAPARSTQRQEAPRQSNQTAPARTARAPAPQQQRAANSQPRTQPSSSSPPRSQERSSRSSSSRSARSENSSRKSNNRDRR
jgi:hypothetical protein